MIYVDEEYPCDDVGPSFPHKNVKLQVDIDPSSRYEILPELGRGSFGTVFLCRELATDMKLAAKIMPYKKKKDRADMEREIDIMSCLEHPRLIQMCDAIDFDNRIFIFLELIQGGELFERVIDEDFVLTERACAVFMRQICEGIEFIHSKRIIHLDMKPENILCLTKTGNRIKIIDFGFARRYDPRKTLQVMFGTPEFSAPEVVNFDDICFYTDMWSVGVICYVLVSGLSPFVGDDEVQTMTNVTLGNYSFNYASFDDVSEKAKDFIRLLLVKEGRKRLTAKQALRHPWLADVVQQRNTELSVTETKLKRYVIKKRWVKAINTIIAIQRFKKGAVALRRGSHHIRELEKGI